MARPTLTEIKHMLPACTIPGYTMDRVFRKLGIPRNGLVESAELINFLKIPSDSFIADIIREKYQREYVSTKYCLEAVKILAIGTSTYSVLNFLNVI